MEIVSPEGRAQRYAYDVLGQSVSFMYDSMDRVLSATDGSITTAEYDALGRVKTLVNYDGTGEKVSSFAYTYDATGNIATEAVSMEGETVQRSYAYTERGELARVTENGETTVYAYDAAGNRIKEEGPEGTTVYRYDEANRLQSTEGARVSAYTWDADGNMVSAETDEGAYEYLYDTESRLLAVREGGSLLMSMLYDGLDNRVCALRAAEWQAERTMQRKEQKWVYAAGVQGANAPKAEDARRAPAGAAESAPERENANSSKGDLAASEYEAQAGAQGAGPHPFWYGFGQGMLGGFAVFNVPAAAELHIRFYEWWTQLWSGGDLSAAGSGTEAEAETGGAGGAGDASGPSAGAPENGANSANAEGAGGEENDLRGVRRLITQSFAGQEEYTLTGYDVIYYVNDLNRENAEVLAAASQSAEQAGTGTEEAAPAGAMARSTGAENAADPEGKNAGLFAGEDSGMETEHYTYGVQRLYAERGEESETYLYDGRGSVVQLLKGGTVSQSYSYNAYGYINADEYGVHEPFYGYNGEEHDPFTGLQYLRARYYAPQTGGFITQDSFAGILTNALSQNRYTYAENDPVNGIDPSGHAKVSRNGAKSGGSSKTNTAGRLSQSSKAPASTAAGKQQSPAKKPYTAAPTPPKPAPNYQKPTTYSSGAAKAA